MAHPERGEMILNRLAEDLGELAVVEQRPQQDGRNMTMMLAPGKAMTAEALRLAQDQDLDLVEVAPESKPPVCRVLDYSKYKYEQAQKQKAARKHQTQINIREIKFRPKIAQHDYDTKKGHV